MRKLAVALLLTLSGSAADWLMSRADPQGTGWQQHGRSISAANAHELKLLWKRTLDNQSRGSNSLTAPTILGPIVTHRGIKELVFVGGSADNIYAVDADLGRVFWRRHIDNGDGPKLPCDEGLTAAPAFAPPPPGAKVREESDEGASPMRPFYFAASDGILHTVRPSDGIDMAPARKFVPAGANLSALLYSNHHIYANTSRGCGGVANGVWAIDTSNPDAKVGFFGGQTGTLSVGLDGTVYLASADKNVALEPGTLKLKTSSVVGRNLVINGKVFPVSGGEIRGSATSVDTGGTRWVYAATNEGIRAFRVVEKAGKSTLKAEWAVQNIASPLEPAIVNGVVFVLASGDKSTHAILYALDAHTGEQLYQSGDAVTSFVHSSGLAIANGHVCFGTWDNTLYCFGFPIEIE